MLHHDHEPGLRISTPRSTRACRGQAVTLRLAVDFLSWYASATNIRSQCSEMYSIL